MREEQQLDCKDGNAAGKAASKPSVETPTTSARWTRAIMIRSGAGVRAVGPAALQVVCDTGIYSLDAALQKRDVPGWFVLGQVFLRDNKPAEELEVSLYVDEKPVDVLKTDAFGEFAFTSRPGRRLGVALHGTELALVELWNAE